jgi:RND superfamily putative drug exporter
VRLATERPALVAAACVALLAVGAAGAARLDVGNPLIRGLPPDADARQAYEAAARGFAPGILSPTVVVVERDRIAAERRALARLQRSIARQPGVAEVAGPADSPFDIALGATLSRTGDAARYVVVLDADPLGSAAIGHLRTLERRMPALLDAAGIPRAEASFAGDTALVEDTVGKTFADLGRVAPVAMLAVFVVLAVFLRAAVAPLYLLAASVLALFAALGATVFVFQDLLGRGELTYYVPFAAAVLLLSLGSDYNVFIVGRIWQEARERPLLPAIVVGGSRAAKPITVAGLILAASFALLWLVPVSGFQELGTAMAIGLILDAFLVRTLLVPALIALVGERSGWPGRALAGHHSEVLRSAGAALSRRAARGSDGSSAARRDEAAVAGRHSTGTGR